MSGYGTWNSSFDSAVVARLGESKRRFAPFISPELYRAKRAAWGQQRWFEPAASEGDPPIQTRVISAVGRSFAALVLEGYHRNAISSTDVSDSLGIQLRYLDRIAAELTI
jgi:hypothetical protein